MNNNENNKEPVINFGNSLNSNNKEVNQGVQQVSTPQQPIQTTQTPSLNPSQSPSSNQTQPQTQPVANTQNTIKSIENPTNAVMSREELNQKIAEANPSDVKDRSIVKLIVLVILKFIFPPLIIFFILYSLYSNGLLNGQKQNAFLATASDYIDRAHKEVEKSNDPKCNRDTTVIRKIPLNDLIDGTTSSISSYGGTIDLINSYVNIKVNYNNNNNTCDYEYSIYMTDDKYSLGSKDNPILESNVSNSKVIQVSEKNN